MIKAPSVDTDHKTSIGSVIKQLRISQHLTQQKLANLVGVSPKDISLLEQNLSLPLDRQLKVLRELWVRKVNIKSI